MLIVCLPLGTSTGINYEKQLDSYLCNCKRGGIIPEEHLHSCMNTTNHAITRGSILHHMKQDHSCLKIYNQIAKNGQGLETGMQTRE
jgi:hypothetical protein